MSKKLEPIATKTPGVETWEVLRDLGFVEDKSVISEPRPGLSFDFGNFTLHAGRHVNQYFQNVVHLSGVISSSRVLGEVYHQFPLELESLEQGKALLAWCLDRATSRSFKLAIEPPWLIEGRRNHHLLPWERERAAYEARPHCYVQREWARIVFKELAEAIRSVTDDAPVTLFFDGTILQIGCASRVLPMPAKGRAWTQRFAMPAESLRRLPKRLMRSRIEVSVWQSNLTIGNVRYRGVRPLEEPQAK